MKVTPSIVAMRSESGIMKYVKNTTNKATSIWFTKVKVEGNKRKSVILLNQKGCDGSELHRLCNAEEQELSRKLRNKCLTSILTLQLKSPVQQNRRILIQR